MTSRPHPLSGERVRVLILIKGLGLGGAETLLLNAAPHFDRDRFDYTIGYFLPWKDALCGPLRDAGLNVQCFNIPRAGSPFALARFCRRVKRENYQLLHMHLPIPGFYGRVARKLHRNLRVVYTEHNLWPRLNPVSRALNRFTFHWNDAAIAVSNEVRDSITARRPKTQTIENGIDCSSIQQDAGARHEIREELGIALDEVAIVKVANLTEKKNHELLLDAFAQLNQQFPKAKLVLVGQFADRRETLAKKTEELGITSRVVFTGPRSDIPRVLMASDIFAMSSRFEGMPIALLEAMAYGLPPVCTAVGGVPDVIRDGVDGFLVPSGDAQVLAEKLQLLCTNGSLRQQFGAAAAARIHDEFDIAEMVQRVESVYESVLEKQ